MQSCFAKHLWYCSIQKKIAKNLPDAQIKKLKAILLFLFQCIERANGRTFGGLEWGRIVSIELPLGVLSAEIFLPLDLRSWSLPRTVRVELQRELHELCVNHFGVQRLKCSVWADNRRSPCLATDFRRLPVVKPFKRFRRLIKTVHHFPSLLFARNSSMKFLTELDALKALLSFSTKFHCNRRSSNLPTSSKCRMANGGWFAFKVPWTTVNYTFSRG